jgi:hypothetical protein
MGMPGIDLVETRFAVKVERPKAPGGKPDLADVFFGVHRCSHGHGEELPDGFELMPDARQPVRAGELRKPTVKVVRGAIRLSDRIIFGLIVVAVSPANKDQHVPNGYYLTFGTEEKLIINEWWGSSYRFPCHCGPRTRAKHNFRFQ